MLRKAVEGSTPLRPWSLGRVLIYARRAGPGLVVRVKSRAFHQAVSNRRRSLQIRVIEIWAKRW